MGSKKYPQGPKTIQAKCPEVSTALDLSPIPEDREKAAEAPRGDVQNQRAGGGVKILELEDVTFCFLGFWIEG